MDWVMRTYLISPPAETSWTIDLDELRSELRSLWPDVDIVVPARPTPDKILQWKVEVGEHWLEGSLEDARQAIYLRGDVECIAQLAADVKGNLARSQELILCSNDYETVVRLDLGRTEEDVLRALTA
jgi:hypothetical protein